MVAVLAVGSVGNVVPNVGLVSYVGLVAFVVVIVEDVVVVVVVVVVVFMVVGVVTGMVVVLSGSWNTFAYAAAVILTRG